MYVDSFLFFNGGARSSQGQKSPTIMTLITRMSSWMFLLYGTDSKMPLPLFTRDDGELETPAIKQIVPWILAPLVMSSRHEIINSRGIPRTTQPPD